MSLRSEGDADPQTPHEEDEYDYIPVSSRCLACGGYSSELTSMEKLGFCQHCGGLLRKLQPHEIESASLRKKYPSPKSSSSGCMLIVVAFALIILFVHN